MGRTALGSLRLCREYFSRLVPLNVVENEAARSFQRRSSLNSERGCLSSLEPPLVEGSTTHVESADVVAGRPGEELAVDRAVAKSAPTQALKPHGCRNREINDQVAGIHGICAPADHRACEPPIGSDDDDAPDVRPELVELVETGPSPRGRPMLPLSTGVPEEVIASMGETASNSRPPPTPSSTL